MAGKQAVELRCPLALIMFVCFASAALIVLGSSGRWERPDHTVGMAVVTGSVVAPRAEPAVEVKGVQMHGSSGLSTGRSCCLSGVCSAGLRAGVRQSCGIQWNGNGWYGQYEHGHVRG